MKDSIDKQADWGFTNPFSFGLFVEELRCSLYMMKIMEEGMYMPIMVKKFMLMQEIEDAVHIPAMVKSLLLLKMKLVTVDEIFRDRDSQTLLKRLTKPSSCTNSRTPVLVVLPIECFLCFASSSRFFTVRKPTRCVTSAIVRSVVAVSGWKAWPILNRNSLYSTHVCRDKASWISKEYYSQHFTLSQSVEYKMSTLHYTTALCLCINCFPCAQVCHSSACLFRLCLKTGH